MREDFFYTIKYDVPNEPEMEELFNADITTNKLIGFCDAAHANDLRNCCSTTADVFTFMGGAIIYKSKTQSLTLGSSTETEYSSTFCWESCLLFTFLIERSWF